MKNSQTQNEQTDETCNPRIKASCGVVTNIQRLMYVLLSFGFICILFLIQGGEKALMVNNKTNFPIANVLVDFKIFMYFGPAVLILLTVYIHMFIEAWAQCKRAKRHEKLVCLFHCSSTTAWLAFVGIFFLMTPFILFMFILSARAIEDITLVNSLVTIICLIYLSCQMARLNLELSWWIKIPVTGILIGALSFLVAVIWGPLNLLETLPLNIKAADFSDTDLHDTKYLQSARAHKVNFKGSVLYKANLTNLYAPMGNFQNANLTEADLTGANLGTANFTNAIMYNTKLIDAKMADTNFSLASMGGANLTSTKLGTSEDKATTEGAIFYKTDLRDAILKRAFNGCLFFEVDLRNADFSNARLSDAVFIKSDLRDAKNLNQDQLEEVCVDESTKYNKSSFLFQQCEEEKITDATKKILAVNQIFLISENRK